ncbi:hypothetical protein V8B97DRAFT_25945 [Scleroderma yunnanense]
MRNQMLSGTVLLLLLSQSELKFGEFLCTTSSIVANNLLTSAYNGTWMCLSASNSMKSQAHWGAANLFRFSRSEGSDLDVALTKNWHR